MKGTVEECQCIEEMSANVLISKIQRSKQGQIFQIQIKDFGKIVIQSIFRLLPPSYLRSYLCTAALFDGQLLHTSTRHSDFMQEDTANNLCLPILQIFVMQICMLDSAQISVYINLFANMCIAFPDEHEKLASLPICKFSV